MSGVTIGADSVIVNGKIMKTFMSVGVKPKIGAIPNILSEERMYPPVRNVTSANHSITGQVYGNGFYVTSFSNTFGVAGLFEPFKCFNTSDTTGGHWITGNYTQPNGTYNLNHNIVSGYNGDWLKIKFPVAINITRYAFQIRGGSLSRAPGNFKIYGSNDEINWVELTHGTNPTYVNGLYETTITTGTYNSFGLVVNKLVGGDSGAVVLNFDEWFIYGREILSIDNSLIAHYKFDDENNIGFNSSQLGYIFDAKSNGPLEITNAKFVNGGSSLLTTGIYNDISLLIDNNSNKLATYINNNSISISFWCWTISLGSDIGILFYGNPTDKGDNDDIFMLYQQDNVNQLRLIISRGTTHDPLNISINMPLVNVGWTHITVVIELKTANINLAEHTIKSYVNGLLHQIHYNKFYPIITQNYEFQIGRWRNISNRRAYTGYIDDFRIYNKVLSDEEIMLLYMIKETYVKPIVINDDYNYMGFLHNPSTLNNLERMYPPIRNVTSANHLITGQAYGNGFYVISDNGWRTSVQVYNCFNTSDAIGGAWSNVYIIPNGTYNLSNNIVSGYYGDWVKIKFPVAINLTKYSFKIRPDFLSRAPQNFKIYGSNDEANWDELTHGTNPIYVSGLYETTISTLGTYNSFGLVVNKLVGGNNFANILNFDEWFIYGMEINSQTTYTINFSEQTECDILIVGGGGGGGSATNGYEGGGGGAGGVVYMVNKNFNSGTYLINVGKGGNAATNGIDSSITTNTNTNIIIDSISLIGKGGGGGGGSSANSGGSGGSTGNTNSIQGGAATQGNTFWNGTIYVPGGYAGEIGRASKGGGGGGSAEIGGTDNQGHGGDGISVSITGTSAFYSGGGSGVIPGQASSYYSSSDGGGGTPTVSLNGTAPTAGLPNTGSGGGGVYSAQYTGSGIAGVGGSGGSGIVIIRYKIIKENYDAQWTYNPSNPSVYHLGNVGIGTTNPTTALHVVGSVSIVGDYLAKTKTFKIEHPLNENKWLYHGCVEAPRFDNIYRGKKVIKNGNCEVNIDRECNDSGGMTEGTFIALNAKSQLYLQNTNTFDAVKGKIKDGKIIIICENIIDDIEVDWLIIGERQDENIKRNRLTNNEGSLICEHNIY